MSETARILVIDDDESVRKTIAKSLEKAGYRVDTVENGAEAIEKSQATRYNLALIDIRLPDMEGTKLLAAMRDTTPKMVKIILTGYPAMENAIEAVNKGADSYITKPVKIDDLLKLVKMQLAKQQEEMKYSEDRVAAYVGTRFRELEAKEKQSSPKGT